MRQRVRRIEPFSAAKVAGVLYTILGLLFLPFAYLGLRANPAAPVFGSAFALALPIIYGIFGFIFTAIGAALYNIVAGWVGGVEVDLEAVNTPV